MNAPTNWTPGPWRLVGPFKGTVRAGAEWIGKIHWKNREANARLIAAAPDLYADLFALVDYAKKNRIFRDDMGQGVEAHCNQVLAKARGE